MKLGIGSYSFTWAMGVEGYDLPPQKLLTALGLIEKASDLGIGLVQICDNPALHLMDKLELEELQRASRKLGVSLEIGTRGISPEHLLKYLDIAKYLDAKIVRTIIQNPDGIPDIKQAAILLKKALPLFAEAGVAIAVENHERHTVAELAWLINSLQSPWIGICLDTVNSFGAIECPEKVIKELAPYTINLHIKDFKVNRVKSQMGFSIVGCPAGEGMLNIDEVFKVLKQHKKDPNIILELWTPFNETVQKTILEENEWVLKSIKNLRNKLKDI